ncbi:MAG: hypothetical protein M3237_01705 [Actinomycetota bacterium]|nr:hypothetical protein [Actinomycetota bacterium]
MKKLVAAGICALAVTMVAPAPVAQAADRCATKSEYRKIKVGMSKARVTQIIDYGGTRAFYFPPYESREYATCTSEAGFVMVSFERKRVTKKAAVWG